MSLAGNEGKRLPNNCPEIAQHMSLILLIYFQFGQLGNHLFDGKVCKEIPAISGQKAAYCPGLLSIKNRLPNSKRAKLSWEYIGMCVGNDWAITSM